MKKIVILVLLLASYHNLFSQTFSIEKIFPFSTDWQYYEKWDPNEGGAPGILDMIINKNAKVIYSATPISWIFLDELNNKKNQIENSVYASPGFMKNFKDLSILGTFNGSGKAYIFDLTKSFINPIYILNTPPDRINNRIPPYLTGNMLFAETSRGDLISWELLENGQTKYRNIEETKVWLEAGNAEKVGYRKQKKTILFGDFTMKNAALMGWFNWPNYILPDGPYKNMENFGAYIGFDSRGLNYYYFTDISTAMDRPLTMQPAPVYLAIIDTWTKKVYFRKFPEGTWDPPRRETRYNPVPDLIARLAWAVHPNGDVYFFDADVQKKEYQLKKLTNDWWKEIGVDQRRIGRIEQNYIPLRVEPVTTAANNGYNYEREFVWILEESTKTETVAGKAVPWVKVRKLDGREGWILLSDVYFE